MISYLKGSVLSTHKNSIVLLVNDIGYRVNLMPRIALEMKVGEAVELYIHQHVKEDALELYGFSTMREMEFFEKLISISGIGPKSGQGILAVATVDELESAIIRGDASILTKVSGVGKKTAERVVLELKGKIVPGEISGMSSASSSSDVEVIEALESLGYTVEQARNALKEVSPEAETTDQKLKEALKSLGRK